MARVDGETRIARFDSCGCLSSAPLKVALHVILRRVDSFNGFVGRDDRAEDRLALALAHDDQDQQDCEPTEENGLRARARASQASRALVGSIALGTSTEPRPRMTPATGLTHGFVTS